MTGGSEYSEQRSSKRSSKGLFSNAASLIASIHMLNDRQPAEHEQNPENERRRHEDIRQAIRGLAGLIKSVVDELEQFSVMEEEFVDIHEKIFDSGGDPPPSEGTVTIVNIINNFYEDIVNLKNWCAETEIYWAREVPAMQSLSFQVNELYLEIKEELTNIEEGEGGGPPDPHDLDSHTDVTIVTPGARDYLCYDETSEEWVNAPTTLAGCGDTDLPSPGPGEYLCYDDVEEEWISDTVDITDLDGVTIGTPAAGEYICYDDVSGEWVNAPIDLNDLDGVDVIGETAGDYLCYNGTNWVPSTVDITDLDGVVITGPASGEYFCYDGTNWVNAVIDLDDLDGVVISSPSSGQVLKFNGTNWVNDNESGGATIADGTYSPTFSLLSNIEIGGVSAIGDWRYSRVNNTLWVYGNFTADPTSGATTTSFQVDLPITVSGFGGANLDEVAGTVGDNGSSSKGGRVSSVNLSQRVKVEWRSQGAASSTFSVHFMVRI